MRLVIMGTGAFGVPTLEALYETSHEIAGLVTQRAASDRRGRTMPPPEIVRVAEAHQTPIYRFEDIKTPEAVTFLRSLEADLFFICDYGQILSPEGIQAARLGGLNLHGSLLPKYRGAAPVHWAIYHGDRQTGITVIHITPQVDAGPMIAAEVVDILPDETMPELEARLARLGAPHVVRAVEELAANEAVRLHALEQDASQACGAPKLKKRHAQIDWSRSAQAIHDQIRAFEPWPRTFTDWRKSPDKPPLRWIPHPPTRVLAESVSEPPGTILSVGKTLRVATGEGVLELLKIQPAGKKVLTIPELLCGYPIQPGQLFRTEP